MKRSSQTRRTTSPPGSPLTVTGNLPDLEVTNASGPTAVQAGALVAVSWTVNNAGGGPTDAAFWYDRLFLSSTPTLSSDSVQIGEVRHVNPLAAGASYSASGNFPLPADLPAGTYYFVIKTDADGRVIEGDE